MNELNQEGGREEEEEEEESAGTRPHRATRADNPVPWGPYRYDCAPGREQHPGAHGLSQEAAV